VLVVVAAAAAAAGSDPVSCCSTSCREGRKTFSTSGENHDLKVTPFYFHLFHRRVSVDPPRNCFAVAVEDHDVWGLAQKLWRRLFVGPLQTHHSRDQLNNRAFAPVSSLSSRSIPL
jgi:hypothetical protein